VNDNDYRDGWTPEVRAHLLDNIESLRREMTSIMNERDRRYTERSSQQDKAVVDALAAAEKAVNAALVAADKAVNKEETNAQVWRNSANEWRQAMNDRETRFLGKDEAALMVQGITDRVTKIEKAGATAVGRQEGISSAEAVQIRQRTDRTNQTMVLLFAMSTLVGIVAVILSIVLKT
jgi:hypothetical protein